MPGHLCYQFLGEVELQVWTHRILKKIVFAHSVIDSVLIDGHNFISIRAEVASALWWIDNRPPPLLFKRAGLCGEDRLVKFPRLR